MESLLKLEWRDIHLNDKNPEVVISGDTAAGIAEIEDGIREYRATGSTLIVPLAHAPHQFSKLSSVIDGCYRVASLRSSAVYVFSSMLPMCTTCMLMGGKPRQWGCAECGGGEI